MYKAWILFWISFLQIWWSKMDKSLYLFEQFLLKFCYISFLQIWWSKMDKSLYLFEQFLLKFCYISFLQIWFRKMKQNGQIIVLIWAVFIEILLYFFFYQNLIFSNCGKNFWCWHIFCLKINKSSKFQGQERTLWPEPGSKVENLIIFLFIILNRFYKT